MRRIRSREGVRGAALLFSLFAVTIVAGLTMAFLRIGMASTAHQLQLVDQERALAVAEAGLAEGLYALVRGGTGNVASAAAPAVYGDGLFWVEATDFGEGRTRLQAHGMVGKGRAAVAQVWRENEQHKLFGGVVSESDIFIKSNAIVDSFDSGLGSYASQLPPGAEYLGDETIVMANEGIFFGSNGEVYGDAYAGDGYQSDIPNVSGDLEQLRRPFSLDPIEVPPLLIGSAVHVGSDRVLPPGNYGVAGLTLSPMTKLEIQGPATLVVDGPLDLGKFSDLVIDGTNGPVVIYATTDLRADVDSTVSTLFDDPHAATLNIVGAPGDTVQFLNHSTFYGKIYAPGVNVEMGTDWELFGAVAAGAITTNPHTKIHTDTSMFDVENRFRHSHQVWYEDALGDPSWGANRRDPFRMLGVDKLALPKPDDAHEVLP